MTISRSEFATASAVVSDRLKLNFSLAEEVVAAMFRPAEIVRGINDAALSEIARVALHGDARLFAEDHDDPA